MSKHKLEYIWLDGYKPTQSLRSKTKIVNDFNGKLENVGEWNFDGSSTEQASGDDSDTLLKPVAVYPDPDRFGGNGWLPLGFPKNGYPGPQGPYYTSVGAHNAMGRDLVDEHLHLCLEAELNVEGINAEVMMGQWEFQVFAKGAAKAGDEVWMARYIMERTGEKYGVAVDWHPKPVKGDWNGSGMHANFSNGAMREQGGKDMMTKICETFGKNIDRHISVYGADNDQRLTGLHETQAIDKFNYGEFDRGASIRIPVNTIQDDWQGRLEDRRPASNGDPYKIAAAIIQTTKEALA
jgi:glutamine synthetase